MSAAETIHAFGQDYFLQRYPPSKDNALRAWDAADEYLLNTLQEQQIDLSKVCIINDNFGALTLPLATFKPLCYSDSWLSREALFQNLKRNQLEGEINFSSCLEAFIAQPNTAHYIIGRIPKSKRQLAYLLQQLNRWAPADCTLLLAGMDKHLSRGQFDLLAQYFGPARFYPGVKKARIWEAKVDKTLSTPRIEASQLALSAFDLTLASRPNVFSQDKLDIGTRFFLDNFRLLPVRTNVADLACGNGILGLCYLRLHPETELSFVDESFQAIQSTQDNILANMPEAKTQAQAGDGLHDIADQQFELILCNPPFHLQHTVSTEIALNLFKDAWRCLKPLGEFWVVANRHLGYHTVLKSLFGEVKISASNQKFVILTATKA